MTETTKILLDICIVFIAAQVGAEIAQRLKMPGVVGEIVAGVVIGPYCLHWIRLEPHGSLEVLAEIGVVLLLFGVGLETRVSDLKSVGRTAFLVAFLGVVFPFLFGYGWAAFSGEPAHNALFTAAAFAATSVGITARVLAELKALNRIESRIILGAAVIDDVLAMILLGVVTGLRNGSFSFVQVILVIAQALFFIAMVTFVGVRFMQKRSHMLEKPINPRSPLTLSIALCLALAASSSAIGLAAIIGAFLAGMVVAETREQYRLEHEMGPILAVLTPFFFVVTGAKVDIRVLADIGVVGSVLLVTVLAVLGKLIGGVLGARGLGFGSASLIGVGMVPRGEVGIIVASLGLAGGVFGPKIYAILILMSLLTSILAPPVLADLLRRNPAPETPAVDEH